MAKRETEAIARSDIMPSDSTVAIPIGQMTVLEDLVQQLEELVREAKNMPLSSSALIDRKEALELIETLKRSIPEELARARAIIHDRDEILERAREQADRVLERVQTEREQLLGKTEIVQAASREAERMVGEAEQIARRIRSEAENYVESKLANFEVVLQKTLAAVERGRARLAGSLADEELSSDEPE